MANPKKPFAAIVGGSKVSSKIGVIESLLEKVDLLFLGGGMIFTFYKAQGYSVGSSLVEEDKLDLATSLIEKATVKGVKLLLPTDVVVADKFAPDANSKVCVIVRINYVYSLECVHANSRVALLSYSGRVFLVLGNTRSFLHAHRGSECNTDQFCSDCLVQFSCRWYQLLR